MENLTKGSQNIEMENLIEQIIGHIRDVAFSYRATNGALVKKMTTTALLREEKIIKEIINEGMCEELISRIYEETQRSLAGVAPTGGFFCSRVAEKVIRKTEKKINAEMQKEIEREQ